MDDQTIRLILQQVGFENLPKNKADVDQLAAAFRAVVPAAAAEEAALNKGADAAGRHGDAADRAKSKVAGLGQSALQAGRVVQDFTQGGIGGILNNIEGLSVALGGGAGLAGVMTIVGVGLFVFKDKLKAVFEDYFPTVIDAAGDKVERLKERIKELEDKKIKVAVDTLELENARKEVERITAGIKAFEAFTKAQSEEEKGSGAAIKREFAENRGDEAGEKIRKMIGNEQAEQSAPLAAARKKQEDLIAAIQTVNAEKTGGVQDAALDMAVTNLKKQLEAARDEARKILFNITKDDGSAEAAAGDLFKRATEGKGEEQGRAQAELAERLRRVDRDDLAGKVRGQSPAARAEWEDMADWQARNEETEESAEKLRQKLQVQGQTNKELADKAAQKQKDKDDKAEADMAKRVAGASVREIRDVTPKALRGANVGQGTRELEGNIARGIQQDYGANPMEAAVAAQRSVQLQHQGANAIQATQQAVQELMNGMLALNAKMDHLSVGTHELGRRANEVTARMRTNLPRGN